MGATTQDQVGIWSNVTASSRRAFVRDWGHFSRWCQTHGCDALPVHEEAFQHYLSELVLSEHRKFSTIRRRIFTIGSVHVSHNFEDPLRYRNVRALLKRIRSACDPPNTANPLLIADLRRVIESMGDTDRDIRDRALLLAGFVAALSRREIAALRIDQIRQRDDGLVFQLDDGRRSFVAKGTSAKMCPVLALHNWFGASSVFGGHVFRQVRRGDHIQRAGLSERSVCSIVKRRVESIGLDPNLYRGGSLRAGYIVEALRAGVSANEVLEQTGLKSLGGLRPYLQQARDLGMNTVRAFKI